MTTATEQLAGFALDLELESIPAAVRDAARLHLLDTLGCGLAAAATSAATEARGIAEAEGGVAEASVMGLPGRLPAAAAAFANGMLCHGLDFDDTLAATGTHVSTVAAPAALAMAERQGAGGAEALTAYIAAAEIVAAIGLAAPYAMHRRGFHATSVYGVFGAAAAAARLLGLDRGRTVAALGIAGSFASGIFEYLADGSPTKPIHAGWAAQAGIRAALLAERGARGPSTVLEGRFGIFATHGALSETSLAESVAALGREWRTPEISFKPYPSCHFMHGTLDATRHALDGVRLLPGDVDAIVAGVAADAVAYVLEPLAAKREPRTEYDAKFSLPFSIAALIIDGGVGVATYAPDRLRDARLLALAAKVRYEVEPLTNAFGGRVHLDLADGRELSGEAVEPDEVEPDQVREKFRANAQLALSPAASDELEAALLNFESASSVSQALAPMRHAEAAQVLS